MSLDLRRDPFEAFHVPSMHAGLSYLPPRPGWVIRPAPSARIGLYAASDRDEICAVQQGHIDSQRQRMPQTVMEVNACPVVLEKAEYAESVAAIDGRFLLNGAAGDRLRTRFDLQNATPRVQERLAIALRQGRCGGPFHPPVWHGESRDLPIALELRNGFNYYHFTLETLSALTHFAGDDSGQPIHLHMRKAELRGFIPAFIAALFPELAPRVQVHHTPHRYAAVRSVYNHRHYLYQVHDARVDEVTDKAAHAAWRDLRSDQIARRVVIQATFDRSQRLLRDHALRMVPRATVSTMPRLVWVGRTEGAAARQRALTGAEPLLEGLRARGFETVLFEHLAPLEQIAAMQAADIVVAPHGAGLANMLYARPDSLVIEIGNSQTQLYRWGDFLAGAHAVRCAYDTVFCDLSGTEESGVPQTVRDGMLGTHVGRRATELILSLIDRDLRQRQQRAARARKAGASV